jgi:ribosome-associated toxin RatA of RatAB toxin-antitoxin module
MVRAVAALLLLATAALAGDEWERLDVEDGITLETRDVEGSLHEVRATAHVDVPPAALAAVLWNYHDHASFVPHLKHAEVVRDAGDERVVYEQIEIPLIKDRDVVLRIRREVDATTGAIEFRSTAISDEGPPQSSRFVRVRTSTGHWRFVPAGGGTDVTYVIRSDVGGAVPAWIVNRGQREAVPDLVRAIMARARSEAGRTGR